MEQGMLGVEEEGQGPGRMREHLHVWGTWAWKPSPAPGFQGPGFALRIPRYHHFGREASLGPPA